MVIVIFILVGVARIIKNVCFGSCKYVLGKEKLRRKGRGVFFKVVFFLVVIVGFVFRGYFFFGGGRF